MPSEGLVQGRLTEQMQRFVDGYFQIDQIRFDTPFAQSQYAIRLAGQFISPTDVAFDAISARAESENFMIFFRGEGAEQVIYAVPGRLPQPRHRWDIAVLLFVATTISVFITGGLTQSSPDATVHLSWRDGLAYALPLMLILLAHELGHFFVGRRYRMPVSPPFFIPLPVVSLGTLGAVILMRSPAKNRRHLLQLGAAGPLAGLVFAIPLLLYGLTLSTIQPMPSGQAYVMEGNSLLYAGLKFLMLGQWLPSAGGLDVMLHNVAFAAWVGLLVTALNLIPAGQLDGGHAAYTLFGVRIRWLTPVLALILAALGAVTQFWGWLLWAFLLFFLGRTSAVPMDDLTPLDAKHKLLAVFMLLLFVLLFTPIPMRAVNP